MNEQPKTYEQYLASYHGLTPPLRREEWEKQHDQPYPAWYLGPKKERNKGFLHNLSTAILAGQQIDFAPVNKLEERAPHHVTLPREEAEYMLNRIDNMVFILSRMRDILEELLK